MNKPVSPLCGHSICKSCMKRNMDVQIQKQPQYTCSICQQPYEARELQTNLIVLGMISKIKIKCLNEGCTWEGQHDEKEEHHKKCEFYIIVCPNGCLKKHIRGDMDGHMVHCKYQKLPCQYCSLQVRRYALEEHEKNCRDKPSPCPLGCGLNFPRLVKKDQTKNMNREGWGRGYPFNGRNARNFENGRGFLFQDGYTVGTSRTVV